MQLNVFTDYALRTLIFVAANEPGKTQITDLAEAYHISRNHLVKVVNHLSKLGYLHTTRGRNGGIRLGRPADEINLRAVVESTEPGFSMAECFRRGTNHCRLTPVCRLKGILGDATEAFLGELGQYSLADLVLNRRAILSVLKTRTSPPASPVSIP